MTEDFSLRPIIDNQGTELRSEYRKVFRRCEEARLATGYFYVSGFDLYRDELENLKSPEELGHAPIRILMGRETDRFTAEEIQEGMNLRDEVEKAVDEDIGELNDAQMSRLDQLKDFVEEGVVDIKVKTPERGYFHAKGAAFRMPEDESGMRPAATIVGSSNFSKSGHTNNIELNLATRDRRDTEEFEDWFDDQWTTNAEDFSEELVKIIEDNEQYRDWKQQQKEEEQTEDSMDLGKRIEPFEFYKLLAYDALDGRVREGFDNPLYHFQRVGYISALDKLARYNGCIISDSVGLGKSFIGAELLRHYRQLGQECLLVVPATLTEQWRSLLEDETDENGNRYFGLEVDGDRVRVMSITKFQNLEKGDVQGLREGFDVVLIDEAHRFRNTGHWSPDGEDIKGTRRHANMKLLGEKTMIMLTATPVNNSAEDLKNLISLFTDENEIRNMSGLDFDSFDEYNESAKKRKSLIKEGDISQSEIDRLVEKLDEKSEEIGKILEEVMVLRTRKDVKEQLKEEEEFEINFNPPEVHKRNYELPAAYRPAYDILPETMNALHLPHITIKNPNGGTLKALYKLTLLKRLESSPKAFLESLETIYDKETQLLRTLDKLPEEQKIRKLQDQESGSTLEEFVEEEDADGLREVMGEVGLDRTIKLGGNDASDELSRATVEDIMDFIREDLVMLGKFASMFVSGIAPENRQLNEKTHDLKNWLRDEGLDRIPDVERGGYDERVFPSKNLEDANDRLSDFYEAVFEAEKFEDEKVKLLGETLNSIDGKAVIFTQYKPTADYVHDSLVESEDSPLTRSNSAVVKGGDSNKRDIIKRFSPGSAGYQSVVEDDTVSEIDYVVATDTLSEGVNLQDVDNAINYDLPFNPMRIVQRVGRIDRIGTESEKHVFNFFPDEDLEAAIKLLERLRAKIDDIAMIVGKENKILDPNEDEVLDRAGVEKDKKIGEVEQEKVEGSIRESRNVEDVNELDDRDRNKLLGKAGSSEEEVFEKIRLQKELREDHGLRESDFDYAKDFFGNEPEDRDKLYTVLPEDSLKEADVLGLLHEWNQDRDAPLNRVDRQVLYSHSRTGNIEVLNSVRQIDISQGSSCGELPDEHLFSSDINKIKQSVDSKVHESEQDQLKGVKKKGSGISKPQETAIEYLERELVPNNVPGAEDVLERMKQHKLKNTEENRVLREIVFPDEDVSITDRNQENLLDDLREFLDEYIDDSPRYQSDLASKSEVKGEVQAWAVID